jgi:hypothetical protein
MRCNGCADRGRCTFCTESMSVRTASHPQVLPGAKHEADTQIRLEMKIIYCLRRLPELTPEEFRRYWFDVHGPLVRADQHVLRIARYIQVHTDHGPFLERLRVFRGSPEPYGGVAEI